jgi:hypothetical protein
MSMYDLSEDERAFIERRLAQERQAMAVSDAVVRRRHEQMASQYEKRLTSPVGKLWSQQRCGS